MQTDIIHQIFNSTLGIAAQIYFCLGVIVLFILMLFRQKMTVTNSLLATVGLKPVLKRDFIFNLVHALVIVVTMVLFMLAANNN